MLIWPESVLMSRRIVQKNWSVSKSGAETVTAASADSMIFMSALVASRLPAASRLYSSRSLGGTSSGSPMSRKTRERNLWPEK